VLSVKVPMKPKIQVKPIKNESFTYSIASDLPLPGKKIECITLNNCHTYKILSSDVLKFTHSHSL
jgi:hypothetical protein